MSQITTRKRQNIYQIYKGHELPTYDVKYGDLAYTHEDDKKYRFNGTSWAIDTGSGGGGGGGVPEPAIDGSFVRKKDGVSHTWEPASTATGDFKADGTVPMTGDLDMGGKEIKNQPDRETYELVGDNPNMSMHINAAGTSAQMQVIDKATGHIVATMEYYKPDGAIMIDVADPTTGAIKNEFEIKPDGFVYINGSKIITEEHRTYDFVQVVGPLVVNDDTWEDAMVLTTPIRQPGIYEYKWEILFTMNVQNASAKFRYSIDDGATWAVLSKEVKDKTNEETINIWFPYELTTAQVVKLRVQVSKENASNEMICKYGSLVVQRVK